jgi:hypothetical protein
MLSSRQVRGVFGTRLWLKVQASETHVLIKAMNAAVIVLSYYWIMLIIKKTMRKASGKESEKPSTPGNAAKTD